MKSALHTLLLLLVFSPFVVFGQQSNNMLIDAALLKRFQSNNINVVVGIPSTYTITSCTILLTTPKGNVYRTTFTPKDNATSASLLEMLKHNEKGNKIIFTDVSATKGGKNIKLAEQHYIFR